MKDKVILSQLSIRMHIRLVKMVSPHVENMSVLIILGQKRTLAALPATPGGHR